MNKISRYKPIGWRQDSHRHSLAAKGIKTRCNYNYRFAAVEEPKKKADLFEAFRSPEERYGLGKEMTEKKINEKMLEAEVKMNESDVSFEDKRRIMDHQLGPIVERFKEGRCTEDQFNSDVDSKLDHNLKVHSRSMSAFDWSTAEHADKNGNGCFNFIDRAKGSNSFAGKVFKASRSKLRLSEEQVEDIEDHFGTPIEEIPSYEVEEYVIEKMKETQLVHQLDEDPFAAKRIKKNKITTAEKIFGVGIITQSEHIDDMQEDSKYYDDRNCGGGEI